MGCLNSEGQFAHWFGNIHLSGPCNRACYFCIGQHMMALDPLNVLDAWPLPGIEEFVAQLQEKDISEVNLTGSNTDPLLYEHLEELRTYLAARLSRLRLGVRTNGATNLDRLRFFDKASVSVASFDPDLYRRTMGSGRPPSIATIREQFAGDLKLNVVLCPETKTDLLRTIAAARTAGIARVNLREPYGQPHLGDPMPALGFSPSRHHLGMPVYQAFGVDVTYWDVHYVEVESVNLYANGRVSLTYPVTRGHSEAGIVQGQEQFTRSGRVREQWL